MYFKIKTHNPNLVVNTVKASAEALLDWYCISSLPVYGRRTTSDVFSGINFILKATQAVMSGVETTKESAHSDAFMDLTLQTIDCAAYLYCLSNNCGDTYFPVSVALSLVGALSSVFNQKQVPNIEEPPRQQPYAPQLF